MKAPTKIALLALVQSVLLFTQGAFAMSEEQLNLRTPDKIQEIFTRNNFVFQAIRAEMQRSGITELDVLWDHRKDFKTVQCNHANNQQGCLWASRFDGPSNRHPIAILPGFTEYRKQYLEMIYDLLGQGYGPIYALDFQNHGQSFQSQLKPGRHLPNLKAWAASQSASEQESFRQDLQKILSPLNETSKANQVLSVVEQLPVGLGHVDSMNDFANNLHWFFPEIEKDLKSQGIQEKLTVIAHSAGSMSFLRALANPHEQWSQDLQRVIFMVPMLSIHLNFGGQAIPNEVAEALLTVKEPLGPKDLAFGAGNLPSFLDRALGHFTPGNVLTHSGIRKTFSDTLRTWDGFDTVGATQSWALEELRGEFRPGEILPLHGLNQQLPDIQDKIDRHQIAVDLIAAGNDAVAQTNVTEAYGDALSEGNRHRKIRFCNVIGANHVIHQEIDRYRTPMLHFIASTMGGKDFSAEDQKTLVCHQY